MSPRSVIVFPLSSMTVAVLETARLGDLVIVISVGSSAVFPSVSSPSSEVS